MEEDKVSFSRICKVISKVRCKEKIKSQEEKITETKATVESVKSQIDSNEKSVFNDFCQSIGIQNIREYEECQVHAKKLRKEKLQKFDQDIQKIKTTLRFYEDNINDLQQNVSKWEVEVQKSEKLLKNCEDTLQKFTDLLNEDIGKAEQFQTQYETEKRSVSELETVIRKLEKTCDNLNKEYLKTEIEKDRLECLIEKNLNTLYFTLSNCKVKGIHIPLLNGDLDEIIDSSGSDTSQQQPQSLSRYEKLLNLEIEYSSLPKNIKSPSDPSTVKKSLEQKIEKLDKELSEMKEGRLHREEKLYNLNEELKHLQDNLKECTKNLHEAIKNFKTITHKRATAFSDFIVNVNGKLSEIYRALYNSASVESFLTATNDSEPYLGEIIYRCFPPSKSHMSINSLSGGEKALASLTLLIAIQQVSKEAPFLIMDEIDVALDKINLKRLLNYLKHLKTEEQIFVISHNDILLEAADMLIGITQVQIDGCSFSELYSENMEDEAPEEESMPYLSTIK